MSLNSKRQFSIATADRVNGIESDFYSIEELLFPTEEQETELHFSVQEYTDELMDLKVGTGMIQPMRDNLGDMWIYRIK